MSAQLSPADRLENEDAVLTRSDLARLGWERRGIDAVMRGAETLHVPGYKRSLLTVAAYRAFLAQHTYRGDRVRP
ncbi:MAG: hypothetical protein ACKVUT_14225 [Gaiella sp.]